MDDNVIDLIVKLRERAANDKSRPEEWAFGQKPDYLAHVDKLKNKFGITEAMIADFTRVCDQTGMGEKLRKE